ncbi:MAG: hypothetical protein ACJ711_06050 [Ornithinibacter sp.]
MSTDTFEDQLRSLLHDTADAEGPAYVDVDPDAVVTSGRRVIRRRRLATGAGIAAAVLAIGAGSALVRAVGEDRAGTTVPAGPTSGLGAGYVSVDLDVSATLPGEQTAASDGPASVRVAVDERTLTWRATVTGRDGRPTTRPATTLPANPRFSTYAEVGNRPGLIVGLMPAAAKDIVAVWGTDPVESSFSSAPVPGTDRQAFAVRHSAAADPNVPGDTALAGFDWTDGQQVYTSAGSTVPSERIGDEVVFVDRQQGLMGIFGPGSTASKRLKDTPAGQQPAMMTGNVAEGSDAMEASVLVLLPAGATQVKVDAAPGVTLLSTNSTSGRSTGDTMVLTHLRVPKGVPGTGVDRVVWTNPDGTTASTEVG